MKTILTFLLLIFAFPSVAQEEGVTSPEIVIRVPMGEIVTIEGVQVQFEVLEDSRCPKNTTCVWEGRAILAVSAGKKDEISEPMSVIFGKVLQNEIESKVFYETDTFLIKAVGLTPYPEVGGDKEPYVLLVRCVDKS